MVSAWVAAALVCLLLLPAYMPANTVLARLRSIGDPDDLSRRKRLTSSRAALNILADRPFWGAGWGLVEKTYEQFYLPDRLTETAAITQNGYLYLGLSAGLPAMVWLFAYLLLVVPSFSSAPGPTAGREHLKWLATRPVGCQAALFALLTIFFFDGGLSNVWVSPLFWVLVELARELPSCCVADMAPEVAQAKPLTAKSWLHRGIPVKNGLGLVVRCSRARANMLVIALLSLLGGLLASSATTPYRQIQFTLKAREWGHLQCVAVLPKRSEPTPVVLYVQGDGVEYLATGVVLRQFANVGLAAVAMDYNKTDEAAFIEQINYAHRYVSSQSWANAAAIVWVGSSLGAQRVLSAVLNEQAVQPAAMVRVCGGWVEPLLRLYGIANPDYPGRALEGHPAWHDPKGGTRVRCPVLLAHGTADQAFRIETARELASALAADGTKVDSWELNGLDHFLGGKRPIVVRMVAEWCSRIVGGGNLHWGSASGFDWGVWLAACGAWFLSGVVACKLLLKHRRRATTRWPHWLWPLSSVFCFALLILGAAPLLPVTKSTIALARIFLVPPSLRPDLEWLSRLPGWEAHNLGTLSEHLKLAARGRNVLHEGLPANDRRAFLLSPALEDTGLWDFDWRRTLWRFFYPRVRTELCAERAAEIVSQALRVRVGISPDVPGGQTLKEMWRRGWATPRDFERIYVGAMRAVGIAARLGPDGRAEIWIPDTGTWETAPRALEFVENSLPRADGHSENKGVTK